MPIHPDKQPRLALPEEEKIYLADQDVADIIFDSFEISQSIGSKQNIVLGLIAQKYPSLQILDDTETIAQMFLQKYGGFLRDGKGHVSLDDTRIKESAKMYIDSFRAYLERRASITYAPFPQKEIYESVVEKDYDFLYIRGWRYHASEANKFSSYTKKYFIDGLQSKNPQVLGIMQDVSAEFFVALQKEGVNLSDEHSVRAVERATAGFSIREGNPSFMGKLMVVAQTWERLNPDKKFWKKSERVRRM